MIYIAIYVSIISSLRWDASPELRAKYFEQSIELIRNWDFFIKVRFYALSKFWLLLPKCLEIKWALGIVPAKVWDSQIFSFQNSNCFSCLVTALTYSLNCLGPSSWTTIYQENRKPTKVKAIFSGKVSKTVLHLVGGSFSYDPYWNKSLVYRKSKKG